MSSPTPLPNLSITATPLTSGGIGYFAGNFTDAGGNSFNKYVTITIKNAQSKDTPLNFLSLLQLYPPLNANTDWFQCMFCIGNIRTSFLGRE